MEAEQRAEEIKMIKCFESWPLFPFLPMKKRKPGGGWPDMGVMTTMTGTDVLKVSVDKLMQNPALMKEAERDKFISAEAIVDAGWVVD